MDERETVKFPLITEKAVNVIETENKLVFIVNKKSTKTEIKKAVEKLFEVKVDSINTVNDAKGKKKAIVKINKKFKANDIAIKLGVL